MPPVSTFRRFAAVLIGLIGLSLLVSACGGAPSSPLAQHGSTNPTETSAGSTAGGKYASALDYSRCMRLHGVPNFPDPVFGRAGFGVAVPLAPGQDPDSPAILNAEKACAGVGTPLPGV